MQVQNITNSQHQTQSFQGSIAVWGGDLSYIPCRQIRKAYPKLQELFADKNFDLFIKEDHRANQLIFMAKKPEHFGRKYKPSVKAYISNHEIKNSDDLYYSVAKHVAEEYEQLAVQKTFGQKCKSFFNNLGKKFMQIMQNE